MLKKYVNLKKRHYRIRKKIVGTATVPRVSVRRSLANLHVQIVDDTAGRTIAALSTVSEKLKSAVAYGGNRKAAEQLGILLAAAIKEKGIKRVCFDRGGYAFHGRVKVLAETLRKQGIAL